VNGKADPIETDSLTKELLDTNKCYILDCGLEVFVWLGRNTSLDERKRASGATDVIIFLGFSVLLSIFQEF
jgi:gelsolin